MPQNTHLPSMRSIIVIAAIALAVGFLAPGIFRNIGTARACGAASAAIDVKMALSVAGNDDRSGSMAAASTLVVDTGASVVALTARDAARLGIHPSPNAFVADVKTANGTVRAAPARLDVVQIGGLELRDVTALVLPDDALSDNLLGLSFLSRLHRFEYTDGNLVLEQ
jgi:aspartyl protease family protein